VKNNSTLIFLFSGLLAVAGPVTYGYAAARQKASYGTRVKYATGKKIEFPDFTVQYVGEHRKSSPVCPRGFLYCDFKVSKGNTEKTFFGLQASASSVQWTLKLAASITDLNYAIRINWDS